MNLQIDPELIEDGVILFQSCSLTDPNLSDIDFENKMAWVWTNRTIFWDPPPYTFFSYFYVQNEVAENESLHYSIFYNNAIYLAVHMLFSIVFFKNSTPLMNYVISIIMSAGFVAGISNTK